MKKRPFKNNVHGLILLLFFISSNLLAQTPSAEVVSIDTTVCESGNIAFKVKFTGKASFGIVYQVLDIEANNTITYSRIHQSDAIKTEDMDGNNVWTETLSISYNATITVTKVFDKTIPQRDNSTPGDPAWLLEDGIVITSQSMNVSVDHKPTPNAGDDISGLCGYIATLNATPGETTNPYYWSNTDEGTFKDIADPHTDFIANDHEGGTYTLWFVEESGVCKDSSSVDVELLGSASASLSGTSTICSTDNINDQITTTLNYNSSSVPYSYTISDGTKDYTFNGLTTTPDIKILPATGNQVFKITSLSDTRGGKQCFAGEEDLPGEAVVTDLKPAAYPGEDTIVCGQLTTTLDAKLEDAGNFGLWSTTGSDITFGNPASPVSTATASAFGIYTITWTETEPVLNCSNSNDVEVNFAESPGLTYSKDTAICRGGIATLELNATGNNPWILSYTIDNSKTDIILDQPYKKRNFSPDNTTIVYIDSITGNYGCVTKLNGEYTITVDEMPHASAGQYDPVCSNQIQLHAVPSIINSYGTWDGTGEFEDIHNPVTLFTASGYGEQIVTWFEINLNNPNCKDISAVTIRLDQTPDQPYAGKDQRIYLEYSTTLNADPPSIGTGTWSSSEPYITFADPNDPYTTVNDLKMGKQTLTWTVVNGVCAALAERVMIEVKGLTSPTGFSPNGDGVNDYFKIMGAQQITGNELQVFDMNGNLVYSTKNYQNDWAGTNMDGSPLDDGTYYYIFTGDNIDPIKDYLIIKRTKTK